MGIQEEFSLSFFIKNFIQQNTLGWKTQGSE